MSTDIAPDEPADDLPRPSQLWRREGSSVLAPNTLRGDHHWHYAPGSTISYRGTETRQDEAPAFSWLGVAPCD